jgi:hypothetical protein
VSITVNGKQFLIRSEPLSNPDERITICLQRDIPKAELPEETAPEALIDVMRTIAEHCVSCDHGIVIHDGSVRTTNGYLRKHMDEEARGIAKTTGILTSRSRPVGLALLMTAPAGIWYATLSQDASFVRLHPAASHVFLVEGMTPELLSLLAAWSADMAFPGYPYPLVLADQMARVTNNERDAWKMILASDEQAMRVISGELRASDCHAMLEHILYGKQMY